jgi:hypothetical protein
MGDTLENEVLEKIKHAMKVLDDTSLGYQIRGSWNGTLRELREFYFGLRDREEKSDGDDSGFE